MKKYPTDLQFYPLISLAIFGLAFISMQNIPNTFFYLLCAFLAISNSLVYMHQLYFIYTVIGNKKLVKRHIILLCSSIAAIVLGILLTVLNIQSEYGVAIKPKALNEAFITGFGGVAIIAGLLCIGNIIYLIKPYASPLKIVGMIFYGILWLFAALLTFIVSAFLDLVHNPDVE